MLIPHVTELIDHYGNWIYPITFLWTALEGETFVIFAGLAAQKGMINIWLILLAAWSGSFCGDQVFFYTGRRWGIHILDYFPKLRPPVDRALGWLERHAAVFILAYRFMYGIRNISGVAVGMSQLPWRKFLIWNAIAALIWAISFVGFGYLFGDVIEHIHQRHQQVDESVHQITMTVLALFLFIVAYRGIIYVLRSRKKNVEVATFKSTLEKQKDDV